MQNLLISLHVLFAIFAIGPLVGAATTAARGVKAGDGVAVASSARTVRIYGYASLAVAVLGFGLVQPKWHNKFTYPWVWISVLLYVAAVLLTLVLLVPSLRKAGESITAGTGAQAFVGRVGAAGGVVAILFAVIVFLMVYQPGGYSGPN
jgi:uncharacterized membrane protein